MTVCFQPLARVGFCLWEACLFCGIAFPFVSFLGLDLCCWLSFSFCPIGRTWIFVLAFCPFLFCLWLSLAFMLHIINGTETCPFFRFWFLFVFLSCIILLVGVRLCNAGQPNHPRLHHGPRKCIQTLGQNLLDQFLHLQPNVLPSNSP